MEPHRLLAVLPDLISSACAVFSRQLHAIGLSMMLATSLVTLTTAASSAHGQVTARQDSVLVRADRLARTSQGGARALIDSLLAATPSLSPVHPEALYRRARLASEERDAVHDYLRVIIEYPLAPRVPDALVALGTLERQMGDTERAMSHLRRFVLEFPDHPERPRGVLALTQLLMGVNRLGEACAILLPVAVTVAEDQAELRNQLEYQSRRCRGVDTSRRAIDSIAQLQAGRLSAPPPNAATAVDSTTPPPVANPPAGRATPPPVANPPTGRATPPATKSATQYTVQVGAFQTRAEADRLATQLRGDGLEARVVGTARPFRVHVGRYAARADADAMARRLTARGITNFVTTIPPEAR
jgi:hypothetical protein